MDPHMKPLLQVRGLRVHFPGPPQGVLLRRRGLIRAVDGVDLDIARGETLGLVGESGCGKSTTGRGIRQLVTPTAGSVRFDGTELVGLSQAQMRPLRKRMQMVFQDPYGSLNPRLTVGAALGEVFRVHELCPPDQVGERVGRLMRDVGLPPELVDRRPAALSGGQCQRVGIARALAVGPDLVIADEAVSALDVSIQAQIINLLADLREELGLTYLIIGHDLSVVKHLCNRVAVMYLGKLVETASVKELFDHPQHPYTRALLSAVPVPDPAAERRRKHEILPGEVPSPLNPPSGCVFHPRCYLAVEACQGERPALQETRPGHWVACPRVGA